MRRGGTSRRETAPRQFGHRTAAARFPVAGPSASQWRTTPAVSPNHPGDDSASPSIQPKNLRLAVLERLNHRQQLPSANRPDAWYDLASLPSLLMDHRMMIEKALATRQSNLDQKLPGFNRLPAVFTMGDRQTLSETMLGKSNCGLIFSERC